MKFVLCMFLIVLICLDFSSFGQRDFLIVRSTKPNNVLPGSICDRPNYLKYMLPVYIEAEKGTTRQNLTLLEAHLKNLTDSEAKRELDAANKSRRRKRQTKLNIGDYVYTDDLIYTAGDIFAGSICISEAPMECTENSTCGCYNDKHEYNFIEEDFRCVVILGTFCLEDFRPEKKKHLIRCAKGSRCLDGKCQAGAFRKLRPDIGILVVGSFLVIFTPEHFLLW